MYVMGLQSECTCKFHKNIKTQSSPVDPWGSRLGACTWCGWVGVLRGTRGRRGFRNRDMRVWWGRRDMHLENRWRGDHSSHIVEAFFLLTQNGQDRLILYQFLFEVQFMTNWFPHTFIQRFLPRTGVKDWVHWIHPKLRSSPEPS